jgi:hypothetical protein
VVTKVLFWTLAVADLVGILIWFVLGLAAAGPSRTNPLTVVALLLVLPGALLAAAVIVHVRAESAALRLLALVVVAAPAVFLAAQAAMASFRAGPMHPAGQGETDLTQALRALAKDADRLPEVRALLAAGADPDAGGTPPLALAIYASRSVGLAAVEAVLAAGVDVNRRDEWGEPAWFAVTGTGIDAAVLIHLLERGLDATACGRGGHSAVWSAIATRNWPVAKVLVERGAGVDGRSPMGLSLQATLEAHVRDHDGGDGAAEVLAAARARG